MIKEGSSLFCPNCGRTWSPSEKSFYDDEYSYNVDNDPEVYHNLYGEYPDGYDYHTGRWIDEDHDESDW